MSGMLRSMIVVASSAAAIGGSIGAGAPAAHAAAQDRIAILSEADLASELDRRTACSPRASALCIAIPPVCKHAHVAAPY